MNRNNEGMDWFEATVISWLGACLVVATLMTVTGNYGAASNLALIGLAMIAITFAIIGAYVVIWGLILDVRYSRRTNRGKTPPKKVYDWQVSGL